MIESSKKEVAKLVEIGKTSRVVPYWKKFDLKKNWIQIVIFWIIFLRIDHCVPRPKKESSDIFSTSIKESNFARSAASVVIRTLGQQNFLIYK
jgi:hypothetical protein